MVPRWLVRLLEVVLPEDRHDDLVGDLEEMHRRRLGRGSGGPTDPGRGGSLGGWLHAHLATFAEAAVLLLRFTLGRLPSVAVGAVRGVSASELRLALRLVRKQPVMTATSVVALGVGIGIVAGGFSVFHQVLSSDLGWPEGERWVLLESRHAETRARESMTLEFLEALRAEAPALAYVGATRNGDFNVVHGGRPGAASGLGSGDGSRGGEVERVVGTRLTPGTFRHLPYTPLLGRLLVPADGRPGATPVALIRESFWDRRWARSPEVLGARLTVVGTEHRIVGVLPDAAGYPNDGELWLPLSEATLGASAAPDPIGTRLVGVLASAGGSTGLSDSRPARSAETRRNQARVQAQQIADRLAAPGRGLPPLTLTVRPLGQIPVTPSLQVGIAVVMGLLLAILLVIAANVANLVVARTSRRGPELAVRTALGASRSRIVGQLFVEMLLIGALASALGLSLAAGILRVYDRVLDELPFWVELSLEPSTGAAVAVLVLLVAGVTGVLPALRATGKAPGDALRGSGPGGLGQALRVGRLGGVMIAAEVALSVALLGSAVLFAEGYQRYLQPTFDLPEDEVLTARLTLDLDEGDLVEGGAPTVRDSLRGLLDALERGVGELPGVEAVTLASDLPRSSPWPEPVELDGPGELAPAPVIWVGDGFLDVLRIQPLEGRGIDVRDLEPGAPAVAVVNRAFAEARFGTTSVLGRRLRLAPHDDEPAGPWREIVGVVPDRVEVADAERGQGVYLPLIPRRFLSLAVRTAGDPLQLAGPLRRVAYDLDPELALHTVVRLDDVGAENRRALAVMTSGLLGIGLVTLLLSLAGVYSLVSLAVSRRTREIGVRVALGAEPGSILWGVLRRSGLLVLAGAALGAVGGWQLTRFQLFVFHVPEGGWWLFPALVLLMGFAGMLACWVPARRALAVHPVEALRGDG